MKKSGQKTSLYIGILYPALGANVVSLVEVVLWSVVGAVLVCAMLESLLVF